MYHQCYSAMLQKCQGLSRRQPQMKQSADYDSWSTWRITNIKWMTDSPRFRLRLQVRATKCMPQLPPSLELRTSKMSTKTGREQCIDFLSVDRLEELPANFRATNKLLYFFLFSYSLTFFGSTWNVLRCNIGGILFLRQLSIPFNLNG